MLLQRWESMQGCEASGASRDGFTSGDSPTQLPLTLGGGWQSDSQPRPPPYRGESKTGLLESPRRIHHPVLAGLTGTRKQSPGIHLASPHGNNPSAV